MAIKSKRIGEQVDRNTLGRIRVLNNSGVDIAKGDILSVSGSSASGGHLTVVLADSDSAAGVRCTGMKLVADHDIATGSTGIAVDWQILSVDTTAWGTPGVADGPVYLAGAGTSGATLDGAANAGAGNYVAVIGQVLVAGASGRVLLAPKKWI